MQSYTSRFALAVLVSFIAFGCASSPQNQRRYIAELPSSSETAKSLSDSISASNMPSASVQSQ